MNVSIKRVLALLLAVLMLLPVLAGCKRQAVDESALVITVAKLGYGDQWLKDLAAAYEAETGTKVQVIPKIGDSGLGAIKTEMQSQSSQTDIFFTRASEFFKSIYKGSVNIGGTTYDCEFADLTDVWNHTPAGESKTIKEKMDPAFEEYYNVDGKYYGTPWANGIMGIVRNNTVMNSLGLTEEDMPRTTDELFALCDAVKAKGVAPFIYSMSAEYYSSGSAPIWFAQYEGSESMGYFYKGLDPLGEKSSNLYAFQGQVEALEMVERLINTGNGYQHETSASASFTEMQSTFLLNQALFCVNGAWLETEMDMGQKYTDADVEFVKTPIISSIIDRTPTIADDATLAAVVSFVDGNGEAPAGVSEEDIAIVRDARENSYIRSGFDHTALIPAYSDKVEEAKSFLKFMYSDKGLDIYYKATNGNQLPLENTTGYSQDVQISSFRANINQILDEGKICEYDAYVKAKIFALGGVSRYWYNGSGGFVSELLKGKTPAAICATNNDYLQKNWSFITSY